MSDRKGPGNGGQQHPNMSHQWLRYPVASRLVSKNSVASETKAPKYSFQGEGDNKWFVPGKQWHGEQRLEGQDAYRGPLLNLECSGHTGTHLQSYAVDPRASKATEAKRETLEGYLKRTKGCSSRQAVWPASELRCFYTIAHSMGNTPEQLEATVLLEGYDLVAISETL